MTGSLLGLRGLGRAAVVALITAALAVPIARAQSGPSADADAFAPVEEYARKVEEFTKSAPNLAKKIEEGTKSIDALADAAKARGELEQLRGVVADLLGRVSDNGDLARLGAKALDNSRNKLKALEADTRFKPEEKQLLVDQWKELIRQTVLSGVSAAKRVSFLPDVPPLADQGLSEFESVGWFGLVAPAGTPPEIVNTLNAAFVKALSDPAAIEKIRVLGAEPAPGSPDAFAKFIRSESEKWGKLIAETGIKAE